LSNFIVLESGATNLQWILASSQTILDSGELPGLHPFLTTSESWKSSLQKLYHTLQLSHTTPAYYYGTGCGQVAGCNIVSKHFEQYCPLFFPLEVATDLLAAARALCQSEPGVVCILGTGSNTAFYDGHQLAARRGGFGYVLGDEGSGATLGRILLQAFLYEQLSLKLSSWLVEHHQLNREVIVSSLYQSAAPSRYLAQFAPVVQQWLDKDAVLGELVKDSYRQLAVNCLLPLLEKSDQKSVHFTGSVAFYFKKILAETLAEFDIEIGILLQNPLLQLVRYHQHIA
jgi:N-acetylglucosamine kinase-like BadF-type ATPase